MKRKREDYYGFSDSEEEEEEYANQNNCLVSTSVSNIKITICILEFLTKKEIMTGFLQTCTTIYDGYKRYVFERDFYSQDYKDICSSGKIRIELIDKFLENPKFGICRKDINQNVIKYIIRMNDPNICPTMIENKRKGFDWNNNNKYNLLKYSIKMRSCVFINFLLEKIEDKSQLSIDKRKEFVDTAIESEDETILFEISKHFGFNIPTKYYSFKYLIERKFYGKVINRIEIYDKKNQKVPFKLEDLEEMIDILVERNEFKIIKILLSHYDGNSIQETPLLRALALKYKECVNVILESNKFDVTIGNNRPIILACRNGWTNIVKTMINMKADPSAQENSPIIEASKGGFYDLVKYLMIFNCVDPSCDENYALDEAKRYNHMKVVDLLLLDNRVKTKYLKRKK